MNKYIDLVLCQYDGFTHLFQAPAWTHLRISDKVIVEGFEGGTEEAVVKGIMTVNVTDNKEDYDFILLANGAYSPLRKILCKIFYAELEYEEEENEQE